MDFNYLRRRSIFDPPAPTYPPFDFNQAATAQGQNVTDGSNGTSKLDTPPPVQPDDKSKFSSMYSDIANQQSGPASKKYADFLNTNEPQRDNYKPTKMNRLSAILAGMSDGIAHGGGAGYKTAQGILDEPYNEARSQYDNQGKKLEASAGLEEKDMGRRVGILKDIITQEHQQRTDAETARLNDARIADYKAKGGSYGLHYERITDPNTGKTNVTSMRGSDKLGNVDLGTSALTPSQKIEQAGKTAGAEADATEGSKKRIAAAGIAGRAAAASTALDHKFKNIKDLISWKNDNIPAKYEGRIDAQGNLSYFNKTDPTEAPIETGFNTGKLSDTDKAALAIKLKAAPKADTTKTTDLKRDSNGKVIEATTTTKSNNTAEQTKPIPGNTAMEAFSTDNGKTWKARAKK